MKETSCQRERFSVKEISSTRKKFLIAGRNLLSQRRERRDFLLHKTFSCHMTKKYEFPYMGKKFMSQYAISWEIFPVTRRSFLSQKKISCHWNKFHVIGRILQSQEKISPVYFPLFVLSLFVFRIWLYSLLFKPIGSPHTFDTIQH